MKTNELMIGDYVLVRSSMKPVNIREVNPRQVGYRATPYKFSWVSKDLLEPIPVTSEILERNGFTHCLTAPCGYYHAPAYEISHILFHISEDTYEDTYHTVVFTDHNDNNFVLFNLCYVHELQHALRLCGLNELADNLKQEE